MTSHDPHTNHDLGGVFETSLEMLITIDKYLELIRQRRGDEASVADKVSAEQRSVCLRARARA